MEVEHRITDVRLGPYDNTEGIEHWKVLNMNKKMIGSNRRGEWSNICRQPLHLFFYVGLCAYAAQAVCAEEQRRRKTDRTKRTKKNKKRPKMTKKNQENQEEPERTNWGRPVD